MLVDYSASSGGGDGEADRDAVADDAATTAPAAGVAGARDGGENRRDDQDHGRSPPKGSTTPGDDGAEAAGPSCDPAVQAKVDKFLALKQSRGRDIMHDIRYRKSFRNPRLLEKFKEFYDLDEYGSCYPPEIYDYRDVVKNKNDFYDALNVQVREFEERRAANEERRAAEQRTNIAFVSGKRRRTFE